MIRKNNSYSHSILTLFYLSVLMVQDRDFQFDQWQGGSNTPRVRPCKYMHRTTTYFQNTTFIQIYLRQLTLTLKHKYLGGGTCVKVIQDHLPPGLQREGKIEQGEIKEDCYYSQGILQPKCALNLHITCTKKV